MTTPETSPRPDASIRPDTGAGRLAGEPADPTAERPPAARSADPRPRPSPPVLPAALGLAAGAVALLAGGWLMYAPFAFGYQDFTLSWTDPTITDFYSGLGLVILALLAIAGTAAALWVTLRARGAIAPRPRARRDDPHDRPGPADQQPDELTALLRPLVEALNRDAAAERDAITPTHPEPRA